jgi:predicted ribosomally synthesized peptide with nif11-like leader
MGRDGTVCGKRNAPIHHPFFDPRRMMMNEALMTAVKSKIASDPSFAAALREAGSRDGAINIIKAAGIDVPADVVESRELSDAELDSVSGGTLYCY